MAQITIYLDEKTQHLMKKSAEAAGVSQSKWLACLIHEKAANEWPVSVTELAGAWPDIPVAEKLRSAKSRDVKREKI